MARDDLTADIPLFIQFAENELYRTLNLRNEETALSVDISSGAAAVPTDFKALKVAYYNGTEAVVVDWTAIEDLYRDFPDRADSTTTPEQISREAASFVFGPVATDASAGLKGVYYDKQDPLRTTRLWSLRVFTTPNKTP